MADQSGEASSSSSVAEVPPTAQQLHEELDKIKELLEPEKKRRKLFRTEGKSEQKLEHRLGGILCCAVCLDLPRAAVYQVRNFTFYLSNDFLAFWFNPVKKINLF